jgi:acyl-coenzyme A thioesterase PaaI-like protein
MRRRVTAKQPNASMCLVCGLNNGTGLQASFYELEKEELLAVFQPRPEHQGYPGRLHGGLAAAILDETIGRAINRAGRGDVWGVSVELTTRFRKPIPLEDEVRVIARITRNTSRLFEGTAEILLADGSVAVEGKGKYLKLPLEEISDLDVAEHWRVSPSDRDPQEVEL